MLRNDDGLSRRFDFYQHPVQPLNCPFIQIRGRLIQHEHTGIGGVTGGAGNLLLFSSRQFKNIPVHQIIELQVAFCFFEALLNLLPWDAEIFAAEYKLAGGIEVKELTFGILKNASGERCNIG